MSTNLSIWQSVEKTGTEYTKKFTAGGYSGTSLSGQYVYWRLTELFGPAGTGWGFEIEEERYDEGAPFLFGEQTMFEKSHTVKIRLWYVSGVEKGGIVGYGHTPYMYQTKDKSRIIVDSEAPKKSLTDAIKKCASLLGVGADIYMGLHDDMEYLHQLKDETAIEKAIDKVAEQEKQALERVEYINTTVGLMETARTLHELSVIHKGAIRKLDIRKDEKGKTVIARAFEENRKRFEDKEK